MALNFGTWRIEKSKIFESLGGRVYVKCASCRTTAIAYTVGAVAHTVPIFDELCCRVMNFIYTCRCSDSNLVRSVILHGISAGTSSPLGRNVGFCSARYNMRINDIVASKWNTSMCLDLCKVDSQMVTRAHCLREVLVVRDGTLTISNEQFNSSDLNVMIQLLSI